MHCCLVFTVRQNTPTSRPRLAKLLAGGSQNVPRRGSRARSRRGLPLEPCAVHEHGGGSLCKKSGVRRIPKHRLVSVHTCRVRFRQEINTDTNAECHHVHQLRQLPSSCPDASCFFKAPGVASGSVYEMSTSDPAQQNCYRILLSKTATASC